MPLYEVCRLILDSSVALPELRPVPEGRVQCTFELVSGEDGWPTPAEWSHHWYLPDGRTWCSFAKLQSGHLLRFPAMADFRISHDGRTIRCNSCADTPAETLRHLLLDQVFPLVLSKLGKLVLHASAVVAPQGALAFVGTTGLGKSTLAASFGRNGFPVLTDDGLLLEESAGRLVALPSYPGLRLWPDIASEFSQRELLRRTPVAHYTRKLRLGGDEDQLRFCTEAVALQRLYFLAPADSRDQTVSVAPLPLPDGFIELVKHAYCLDLRDEQTLRDRFEQLARVVTIPGLRRLSYPHDLERLSEVRTAILEDLPSSSAPP